MRLVHRLAPPAVLALLTIVAAPLPGHAAQVPCPSTAGVERCADLVTDAAKLQVDTRVETRTFAAGSCSVAEGHTVPGTRQLLRFTFTTPNVGSGDLYVGSPASHPEWFEWGACHNHYHFREYADYRLWTVDGYAQWAALRAANPTATASEVLAANPEVASHFVAGHKQGFCVIDISLLGWVPAGGRYRSCGDQGISVGYADEYVWSLDGQWVDVTDVPTGRYVLEAEVNAERLYEESNYANNAAAMPVRVAQRE